MSLRHCEQNCNLHKHELLTPSRFLTAHNRTVRSNIADLFMYIEGLYAIIAEHATPQLQELRHEFT